MYIYMHKYTYVHTHISSTAFFPNSQPGVVRFHVEYASSCPPHVLFPFHTAPYIYSLLLRQRVPCGCFVQDLLNFHVV